MTKGCRPRRDQLLCRRRDDGVGDGDGDAGRVGPDRVLEAVDAKRRVGHRHAGVDDDIGNLVEPLAGRVPRRGRRGMGQGGHRDDGHPEGLALQGDVENHGVDAGMGEQDHGVGGIEPMRAQDRLAVALDGMDEAVLPRAHVAPDAMERDHRALDDRPEADDGAGAGKGFERRKRAVAGAEGEDELVLARCLPRRRRRPCR